MMKRFIRILTLAAILVFATASSAQVVREILVEGNDHLSRDRILLGFGVRVGEELSAESVREGIRRLYDMGYLSDVEVLGEPNDDGTITLTLVVEERSRIAEIVIRGNDRIDESDIEDVLRITKGTPFDVSRLEDTRVAVKALYEEKGFPSATVEPSTVELGGNRVRIVFEIVEGVRVNVREITFEGNKSLESDDLQKVMETKEDRWWRTDAFLDRSVLEDDLLRVVELYRNEGYIDARALGYDTEYDESGEKVDVTIRIDEGALYSVRSFEWVNASDFAVDALYDLTSLEAGNTYKPTEAEATIRDAYGWYGERGYIHANIVKREDVEDENHVIVRFHVDEGEPAHVGKIEIAGNTRTKEKVIRRELAIRPGDLYQTSEVIASQRKIANLGFFHGPMVEFAESADPNDVDLIFTVEERQTGRAGVGISHTSEKGITGFLELNEGNLFGNGQFLDLKWEFGKKSTEVVLGFTEPWFMNRRFSVGFDIYDTDDKRTYNVLPEEFYEDAFEDHPDYEAIMDCGEDCSRRYIVERERRGGDVRLGWPFLNSRNTMIYARYTLEQVKLQEYAELIRDVVADTSTGVVTDYETDRYDRTDPDWEWRSGITTTVVRRTTDRRFHPRLGSYTRLTGDLFGGAFGGDVEYQRYILDSRTYFPMPWRFTLMMRGRTGVVTGYGDPSTVPDDTRFELGGVGVNGIRGYDNRSILPEGRDLYGGRTMLLGTLELKVPLTSDTSQLPVHALAFVDAGNTWESVEESHPTQLYWGAGFGLRVEVPVLGNLGVDMGYGFDEDEGGEWTVHYQFGLDY